MTMKVALALAPLALLAGCVTYHNAAIPPAPEGTTVVLKQPVRVGSVVATPMEVAEDSRCPENVRCVWAGQLIVTTRIDGAGWRETVDLKLGEPKSVRGNPVTLVSGLPERRADRETIVNEYRFVYEGR